MDSRKSLQNNSGQLQGNPSQMDPPGNNNGGQNMQLQPGVTPGQNSNTGVNYNFQLITYSILFAIVLYDTSNKKIAAGETQETTEKVPVFVGK
jgi:hypothetical protein